MKTEQIALRLKRRRDLEIELFALPFKPRKPRDTLFAHRPDQTLGAPTDALAHHLEIRFSRVPTPSDIPHEGIDYFLITGAGLLPADFVERTAGRVINAHPGIIPLSRGLDSFKWSIIDKIDIGNSIHFIDDEADAGEVIAIEKTPLFMSDTLEAFSRRHYEMEMTMMCSFDEYLSQQYPKIDMTDVRPARMRMPRDVEERLSQAFEEYKGIYAQDRIS